MKRIDRLIIKAKRSTGIELVHAFVEPMGDQWKVQLQVDHKEPGKPLEIRESLHPTVDAAFEYLSIMAEKYPNSEDLVITLDNM